MFAWTSPSAESDEKPVVMTPSNHSPFAPLLLSPPVPRPMAPSFRIGLYLGPGRGPSNGFIKGPIVALASLMTQWPLVWSALLGSPLTRPVTNGQLVVTGRLSGNGLLSPAQRPFSRSPITQGPSPAPLFQMVHFPK